MKGQKRVKTKAEDKESHGSVKRVRSECCQSLQAPLMRLYI